MNLYKPSNASMSIPALNEGRFAHSFVALASAVLFIPLILYVAGTFYLGEEAGKYIVKAFTVPDVWVRIAFASLVAAAVIFPFRRIKLWVAALVSPFIGCMALNIYSVVARL
jgi:hypothetical protein